MRTQESSAAIPAGFVATADARLLSERWDKMASTLDRHSIDKVRALCAAGRIWSGRRIKPTSGTRVNAGVIELSDLGMALMAAVLAYEKDGQAIGRFLHSISLRAKYGV